jgi:hypothetical protein
MLTSPPVPHRGHADRLREWADPGRRAGRDAVSLADSIVTESGRGGAHPDPVLVGAALTTFPPWPADVSGLRLRFGSRRPWIFTSPRFRRPSTPPPRRCAQRWRPR